MGKSGTTLAVKGTRGDDSNLTIPGGTAITNVTIDGGAGSDTLNLSAYASGVTVVLDGGAKASSIVTPHEFDGLWPNYSLSGPGTVRGTIKNVENLVGTSHDDYLSINIQSVSKSIDGGAGNDFLATTGGGTVRLVGGSGDDWIYCNGIVTAVGGTISGNVATGDGQADYFVCNSAPLILDFEVGIDRLIFEIAPGTTPDNFLAGSWVASGSTGSAYLVNGVAEVTLANVAPDLAQTIELGFSLFSDASGRIEGSPGDDILYPGSDNPAFYVFGADSGNDIAATFDILTDVLVFEDGIVPTWSNTMVNDVEALLGTWAGGSVTIQGLGTDDLAALHIQGVAGDPMVGADGAGPWSTGSDAAAFASTQADFASAALLAG